MTTTKIVPKGQLAEWLKAGGHIGLLAGFDVDTQELARLEKEAKTTHPNYDAEQCHAWAAYSIATRNQVSRTTREQLGPATQDIERLARTHEAQSRGFNILRSQLEEFLASAKKDRLWIWIWRIALFAALSLIAARGFAQTPHDPLILRAQDEGSTLVTRPAGLFVFDCAGTGISCAWNASTSKLTLTVSAGGGSTVTVREVDGTPTVTASVIEFDQANGFVVAEPVGGTARLTLVNVPDSVLAQITTASKVSGAALTLLANIPAGAGIIPDANIDGSAESNEVDHDATVNFVANEHVDHSGVTLTAGAGLSGGGDITANRSFATASGETDFLASGALTCGAATQGRAQVHTTPLQYCDNAATPALQYAAYGTSAGAALTGDSIVSFFPAFTTAQLATELSDEDYEPGDEASTESVLDLADLQEKDIDSLTGQSAIGTNFNFSDGVGDSPSLTFTPQTGTAFSLLVEDTTDDFRITANTASTENVEFENTSTGLMAVFIETADGVLTDLKDAAHLTTGTIAADRHGSGYIDATTDFAAGLCGTNEILEDQGASWACIATPGGGATLWNNIGDASADGSVDFVATQQDIVGQLDAAGQTMLTITNQDADRLNSTTILSLQDFDTADPQAVYVSMIGDVDGTPSTDYEFRQDGATLSQDVLLNGALTINSASAFALEVTGDINTSGDGVDYIGSTTNPFQQIFVNEIVAGTTASGILISNGNMDFVGTIQLPFTANKTFSATPAFDMDLFQAHRMVLTGNVTSSSFTTERHGQFTTLILCQDATGGRTFAWPSNVQLRGGVFAIASGVNECSSWTGWYNATATTWYEVARSTDDVVATGQTININGSALGISHLAASSSADLRGVLSDEVGTGAAMFGLISTMSDDLACTGSQVVRRNAGDTAFECATISAGGAPTDATYIVQTANGSLTAEQVATAGLGISISFAGGDGGAATFAFDASDAGADPALSADQCRFTSNATAAGYLVCEGDTADTIETRIAITDPTSADKTFTIPDADTIAPQSYTCTNQFATALNGTTGAATCTTATLASAQFANQGTTTTVLHGNAAGNPSFGSVVPADMDLTAAYAFSSTGNTFVGASYTSNAADPADTGDFRLGFGEVIAWETAIPGTDVTFGVSGTDAFVFDKSGTVLARFGDTATIPSAVEIDGVPSGAGSTGLHVNSSPTATANSQSLYGVRLTHQFDINSRTSTDTYGLAITPDSNSITTGNINNQYMLYLAALAGSAATNEYGIFVDGLNGTTSLDRLTFNRTAPGSAGQRDSHFFRMRASSFDSSGHLVDWKQFVDVTSDAGASSYTWQSQIDGGGYATRATLTDAGVFNATTLTEGGNGVPNSTDHLGFFAATTSAQLLGVISDEVGTGALMFGLASGMNDDLACTGSQVVRRNAGDTAFECATISAGGAPTDATYIVQTAHASLTAEQVATDGTGIDITFAGGDGGAATFNFNYADTLAGNPAFGIGNAVFSDDCTGGGFLSEGTVANTNEMLYCFPALDEVDTTHELTTNSATQTLTNKTLAAANNVIDADTAIALATDPSDCGANTFATTIAASGNLTCATPTLGTDTNGNYVDDVIAGTGIAVTHTPAEGSDATVALSYSSTLAGNPTFNAEECVFSTDGTGGGGFLCEGTTGGNTNEQLYLFPAVDGADTTSFITVDATQITDVDGNGLAISAGALNVGVGLGLTANANDVSIDYTQTLAGNPALAVSTAIFSDDCTGGGFLSEGSTANTNEMLYCFPSLDEADTTHTLVTTSATQTLTEKTINVESSGNVITTVSKIWIDAAGCDNNTAYLNWDNPVGTADTRPTPACNDTGSIQRPTASFSGSAVNSMERTFRLPSDWTGNIDLDIIYVATAASPTGNTEFDVSTVCRAVGETWDGSFNAIQTITDAQVAQNTLNEATQAALTTTGCAADEMLTLKISRDGVNDTSNDASLVIGVELTMRRAQ